MSSWPLSAGCATHGILWPSKSTEAHPEHGFAHSPASTHLLDITSSQRYFSLTLGLDLGAETCQNPLVATFECMVVRAHWLMVLGCTIGIVRAYATDGSAENVAC
jgi:hypothetical protein